MKSALPLLAAAVLLTSVVGLGSPDGAAATSPGANGDVALDCWKRYAPGKFSGDICVADPSGHVETRLTSTKQFDTGASFSPDGRRMAFSRRFYGPERGDERYDVFVMRSDGSAARRVTDASAGTSYYSPQFIPGTNRILATASGDGSSRGRIVSISSRSGAVERIAAGNNAAISPDGEQIAFTRGSDTNFGYPRLFVMNVDGTDATQISEDRAEVSASDPRWAPSGERIVFSYYELRGPSGVYSVEPDGDDLRPEADVGYALFPIPSPDGGSIVFGTNVRRCSDVPPGAICSEAVVSYRTADGKRTLLSSEQFPTDWGVASGPERSGACGGREATITGTPGDDLIRGTDGVDVIAAGDGRDQVFGFGGGDIICGGPGRDVATGGPGKDRCSGVENPRSCSPLRR